MRDFEQQRLARPKAPPQAEGSQSSGLPDWVSAVGNQGVQRIARATAEWEQMGPDSGVPDDPRDAGTPLLPPEHEHWSEEGHEQVSGSQQGGGREAWKGDVNPMEQGGLGGGAEQQPVELPAPHGADEWEAMGDRGGGDGGGWKEMTKLERDASADPGAAAAGMAGAASGIPGAGQMGDVLGGAGPTGPSGGLALPMPDSTGSSDLEERDR